LAACQREAKVAFGNEQVMLERYVRQPRHVEIQIIGDSFGKCMTLSDRDCSLQRRHQKVIEEAPAPDLSSSLRHQLHEAAVKIAQCVSYEGLGTVEFLVTDNDEFFFLEMNTRLQVEHPITEMILGLDLVELQLRVAAGEPLMLDQKNLQPHGHAVEARLYAEDGDNQFLPSTGTLTKLILPQGKDIRVDTGIREGDKITIHYDPLIAKVIAWGKNREDAYEKLKHALRETQISGIKTNLNFLTGLLTHPDVQKTAQDIEFLDRYIKQKAQQGVLEASDGSAWTQKDGWRLNIPAVQTTRRAELNYEESKHGGTAHLIAPMPGRVVCVLVALNEPVVVGQALMIIEAMKMEHTIRAPHEGIVYDLPFLAGDFCEEGVELVLLRGAI
jgi:3-methylcrotonyl-CoA carboxylase alpha subunit